MAATVSSPETPLLKKQKLDTDGDYCQTKEEYLISVSDAKEEEDSRADANANANADTDTDTDTDADADADADSDSDRDIDSKWREMKAETLRRIANIRKMTMEEGKQYSDMVDESEGFDVPYFPNVGEIGQILPIFGMEDSKEHLERLTNMALDKYNEDNHCDYQLKKVVKANCEAVAGIIYYITFEATSAGADAELETFQAKVWYGVMNRIEVMLCRKKTSAK